ncbi:MAG: type II toxin-antitoxin system ParD family antitoxin [Bryobacteraceae bacterium]
MTITLNPEQEEVVRELMSSGAFASVEDAVDSALDMLKGQNDWLLANREAIEEKIRQGIEQLDRGEGIAEEDLDAYLAKLKTGID